MSAQSLLIQDSPSSPIRLSQWIQEFLKMVQRTANLRSEECKPDDVEEEPIGGIAVLGISNHVGASTAASHEIEGKPHVAQELIGRAAPENLRRSARLRLLFVFSCIVVLIIVAKQTGISKHLERERVRSMMVDVGPLGWLAYVALFAVGGLLHVPGLVFVAAAIFSYGRFAGGVLAYVGSICSVCLGFLVARCLSNGSTLDDIGLPTCIQKCLDHLTIAPIRTVALMRLVMYVAPNFNMGLGLTSVRFRDYAIGSALGLIPMTLLMTTLLDTLLDRGWI